MKLSIPLIFVMLIAGSGAFAAEDKISLADVHRTRDLYKSCLLIQAARLDDRRSEPSAIAEGARSACDDDRSFLVFMISSWVRDDEPEISEQAALRSAQRLAVRYDAEVRPDVIRAVLEHRAAKRKVR
jgi:hypothetical protein